MTPFCLRRLFRRVVQLVGDSNREAGTPLRRSMPPRMPEMTSGFAKKKSSTNQKKSPGAGPGEVADDEGFEPPEPFQARLFSKQVH